MDTNTAAELVTLLQWAFVGAVVGLPSVGLTLRLGLRPLVDAVLRLREHDTTVAAWSEIESLRREVAELRRELHGPLPPVGEEVFRRRRARPPSAVRVAPHRRQRLVQSVVEVAADGSERRAADGSGRSAGSGAWSEGGAGFHPSLTLRMERRGSKTELCERCESFVPRGGSGLPGSGGGVVSYLRSRRILAPESPGVLHGPRIEHRRRIALPGPRGPDPGGRRSRRRPGGGPSLSRRSITVPGR